MDDAPSPPVVPSRWQRFSWLIASVVAAAVLVVAFLQWSRDEPAPDVADLVQRPLALADEDNAFAVLVRAAQSIDRSPWAADLDLYSDVARGKKWDAEKTTLWLNANAHIWPAMERAASLPLSQGPILKSLDDASFPALGPLRELAELAQLRARHLHRQGDRDAALAWLATCLQAGQRVSDSNSVLIVWLTGISMHGYAWQTLDALLAGDPISPATGRALIEALEATRPSAGSLAKVIGNEHVIGTLTIGLMHRERGQRSIGDKDADAMLATSRNLSLLFKPHRTERLHAEHLRKVIDLIDADWPTLRAASNAPSADLFGAGWQRWNPDNLAGRALLGAVTPTLHGILAKRLRTQSAISALQALIAVRLCELEHGTLPEKLADLVPAYLSKVPLDYFDRAPIRYSREHRALWSVGKNNLSITTQNAAVDTSEVYLKIPPRTP